MSIYIASIDKIEVTPEMTRRTRIDTESVDKAWMEGRA
jgi:hypothetical protein